MGQLPQKPIVLAMLLCDQFYRDAASGKLSILGCFHAIASPVFPVRHPELCVYLALTDCHGPVTVTVRVIDRDEDRPPLRSTEMSAAVPDPRGIGEFVLSIRKLEIPSPGEYRVQAFCNGEFLIERRLHVSLRGPRPVG